VSLVGAILGFSWGEHEACRILKKDGRVSPTAHATSTNDASRWLFTFEPFWRTVEVLV
jgi:hypothetical protein